MWIGQGQENKSLYPRKIWEQLFRFPEETPEERKLQEKFGGKV